MTDKRRLVFSIVQFLNREMSSDNLSDDAKESLEVANQCLQTAYNMTQEDNHLEVSQTLEDIFIAATKNEPVRKNDSRDDRAKALHGLFQMKKKGSPSPADKEAADKLKGEGNDLMRTEKFEEAIEKYSK